ncbi:hypothetical protein NA749_043420, partial [Streptomyces justiciae]|nr:hypothetical protein [Streptomyces justiciae]
AHHRPPPAEDERAGRAPRRESPAPPHEAAVPRLDTVELDSTHGPEFIDADAQLNKNRAQLDATQAIALAPTTTYDFITAP